MVQKLEDFVKRYWGYLLQIVVYVFLAIVYALRQNWLFVLAWLLMLASVSSKLYLTLRKSRK